MKALAKLAAVVISGLVLSACGGGGDGSGVPASGTGVSSADSGNASGSGADTGAGSNPGSSGATVAYSVTPSVNGVGGTVNPVGAIPVQAGATAVFTLTPNSGYHVVAVNGTCGGILSNNVYTIQAVSADCTVAVTFANTPSYEVLPYQSDSTGNDTLSMLNTEGAKGYRSLGVYHAYGGGNNDDGWIFVNDGSAPSYSYESIDDPNFEWTRWNNSAASSIINQVNMEGAEGYLLYPVYGYSYYYSFDGIHYRKDGDSSATYSYITLAADSSGSVTDLLAQANAQGKNGYWFMGQIAQCENCDIMFPRFSFWNMYRKNSASNATYVYETLPSSPDLTETDLVAQFNNEGAKGYFALGLVSINTGANEAWLYVKDQTQAATYTYVSEPQQPSNTGFVDRANAWGTQGYAYWGDFTFNRSSTTYDMTFYFKANNCNGFLCLANPLGYFGFAGFGLD